MLLRHLIRRLPLGLVATASTVLAVAAPAHAGLLLSSGTNCGAEPLSQPFTPWVDYSQYTPLPGGSFESGTPSWTLSGGAAVTAGSESYFVGGSSDSSSLSLPDGSSATSPTLCVGVQNPTLRLFALNSGSPLSTLQVNVVFKTSLGIEASLPVATLLAGSSWQPTLPLPFVVNLLSLGGQTPVAFTFTPQGSGGAWQIDDVYVDPFGRGG